MDVYVLAIFHWAVAVMVVLVAALLEVAAVVATAVLAQMERKNDQLWVAI